MILRRATIDDMDRLLEWRNDPVAVKNSITARKISGIDHLAWFTRVLSDQSCEIYIAMEDIYPVGMVRFDYAEPDEKHGHEWVVSVITAPDARSSGHGKQILRMATDLKGDQNLIAFIKGSNVASIKIFESCGFIDAGCVDVNGEALMTYRRGPELPFNQENK